MNITQIKQNVGNAFANVGGKIAGGAAFVGNEVVRIFTLANYHENKKVNRKILDAAMEAKIARVEKRANIVCEASIERLANSNIAHINAPANASKARKALTSIRNGLATYHSNVNQKCDKIARQAGKGTYLALDTVFYYTIGAFGTFRPGVLAGSTIALAVAATVRAVTLVVAQVIGHVLPYVLAAAITAAVLGGAALLALKVSVFLSPIVIAGALGIAIYVEARFRIAKLENQLNKVLTQQAADAQAAAAKAAQLKKVGMMATATAVTAALVYYGVPAVYSAVSTLITGAEAALAAAM